MADPRLPGHECGVEDRRWRRWMEDWAMATALMVIGKTAIEETSQEQEEMSQEEEKMSQEEGEMSQEEGEMRKEEGEMRKEGKIS